MLVKKYNDRQKRNEYALVSSDGSKILQWFGVKKPSEARVEAAERRVQYFKHRKG